MGSMHEPASINLTHAQLVELSKILEENDLEYLDEVKAEVESGIQRSKEMLE